MTVPLRAGSPEANLVHRILTGHTLSVLTAHADRLTAVARAVAYLKAHQPDADIMFLANDIGGRERLVEQLRPRLAPLGIKVERQHTTPRPPWNHGAVRVWSPGDEGGNLRCNVVVVDADAVVAMESASLAHIDICQQIVVTSPEPADLAEACRFTQRINGVREVDAGWAERLWGPEPLEIALGADPL